MPDVPAVSRTRELTDRVAGVFADSGTLAQALPAFESRSAQREMADAVAGTLQNGGVLLVEAGTGTGKTLAYLVPAILSGERVLVSTGTKTLQEQIYFKDLAILREALGVPFTATYMKGRGNYLCLHRFESFRESANSGTARLFGESAAQIFLPIIEQWSTTTETGDRAEIADLPEDLPFWGDIAATSENCIGTECPRYDDCFVTRMRLRAAESSLVVVNHHLLCADAAVRQSAYGEVIPECRYAVVDEAHQLEDVATQYFGVSVSTYRFDELARDAERLIAAGLAGEKAGELNAALERMRERAHEFFRNVANNLPVRSPQASENRLRITGAMLEPHYEDAALLMGTLDLLESTAALIKPPLPDPERPRESTKLDLAGLAQRAGELRDELRFVLKASERDYVYFLETRGRGVFLRAAPIDVSNILRDVLFDRMKSTVLTSATLTVEGSFDYIRSRLGLDTSRATRFLKLASEFDYKRQAILYLPRRMPDPRSVDFAAASAREIISILEASRGRAFVLFTSYAALRAIQAIAEVELPYPILVQGSAPRSALLEQFRTTPNAVLLATSSFWQGVDVMGEALSCVIIDKLPFASPGDPITAARIEAIAERGGQPFGDYQVPLAILALLQGLGRLIRHRDDRGVLAVLDPRLQTMGYGRRFLASLPPAGITREIADVQRFFGEK
ncbi:MAG TPA: ATP-dependent DNA helicase [Vicinamibacterales bacterium]|nr:ATP-dependent DNA helicase [Vicinamibacterales bacterium]